METKITEYFNDIIQQAQNTFETYTHSIDITPKRSILRIKATYKSHRVFVSELLTDQYRKYNYYILEVNFVVAGFDNAPDIRAIKMKYDKIPKNDIDKLVPHLHLKNKTILELTDDIYFYDFIEWIKQNIN